MQQRYELVRQGSMRKACTLSVSVRVLITLFKPCLIARCKLDCSTLMQMAVQLSTELPWRVGGKLVDYWGDLLLDMLLGAKASELRY